MTRIVRELSTGTHHTTVPHALRVVGRRSDLAEPVSAPASAAPALSRRSSVDLRPLVELCTRVAETEDEGARVFAVLVRQPGDVLAELTVLLDAFHEEGGAPGVRRSVSDYARLSSPYRAVLTELDGVLAAPSPSCDRGRRGRRS